MAETGMEVLQRWEDAGARWRLLWLGADEAVVELRACTGEPVDQLRSGDAALLAYLATRTSSE